jgi:hypothetical protein
LTSTFLWYISKTFFISVHTSIEVIFIEKDTVKRHFYVMKKNLLAKHIFNVLNMNNHRYLNVPILCKELQVSILRYMLKKLAEVKTMFNVNSTVIA